MSSSMATITKPNTFLQRLVGAAALDTAIYEEVEADRGAIGQAFLIVVLSSVAAGIGMTGINGPSPAAIPVLSIFALLAWAAWALLTFVLGTQVFAEPQTRSDVGELLRTLGFAATPGWLQVIGLMHAAAMPVFVITQLWMLAATVVAVRQALDYTSTARAIAVCVCGWVLTIGLAAVLGLVFAPPVS